MGETVSSSLKRPARRTVMPSLITVGELQLARALPDHAELYANTIARNVEHIGRWELWAFAVTRESMESRLRLLPGDLEANYGIFDRGNLKGFVNMHSRRGDQAQLGYWLTEEAVGKGIATRAVRALASVCFERLAIQRLQFKIKSCNHKSKRVAERLGAEVIDDNTSNEFVILELNKPSDLPC